MSLLKENNDKRYVVKMGTVFVAGNPFKWTFGLGSELTRELRFTDEIMNTWSTEDLEDAELVSNEYGGEIYVLNVGLEPA